MLSLIAGKTKRLAVQNVGARDGWAPVTFDMLEDQIVPRVVIHVRRVARVVHRVGHVSHQHDVLALIDHLANAERTAKHAHVRMHAHNDDIFDAALLYQVKRFGAVGDCITFLNLQRLDLPVKEPHGFADRAVIVAGLLDIDRHGGFVFVVQIAPAL